MWVGNVCVVCFYGCGWNRTTSMGAMLWASMAARCSGMSRRARIPPCTPGCRVFTRPVHGCNRVQTGEHGIQRAKYKLLQLGLGVMIHWDSKLRCISCEFDRISALYACATAEVLNQTVIRCRCKLTTGRYKSRPRIVARLPERYPERILRGKQYQGI